jgi:hypothetical protein
MHITACPRDSDTLLRFCFDCNSEMEGRRELCDVLNRREICLADLKPFRAHKNVVSKIYN